MNGGKAVPLVSTRKPEVQQFGSVIPMRLGLNPEVRARSVDALNLALANTITLRDLYKKHHWQVAGPTFYQLHLLFDKHYTEQSELVDKIAERIQVLGGIGVAMAADVAELAQVEKPPKGREEPGVQISRLLEAHEVILRHVRQAAKEADEAGDCGTNDLLVADVTRVNELQVWFLSEHLVPLSPVEERNTE